MAVLAHVIAGVLAIYLAGDKLGWAWGVLTFTGWCTVSVLALIGLAIDNDSARTWLLYIPAASYYGAAVALAVGLRELFKPIMMVLGLPGAILLACFGISF